MAAGGGALSGAAMLAELQAAPKPLVYKADDLKYDLGLLAAFDGHPVDPAAYAADREAALQAAATANAQLLVKHVFELPVETLPDVGPVAVLPARTTRLPREKRVPEAKPLTRWEKFALSKGIQKRAKRGRMAFDEAAGEYKPRHGYKRGRDEAGDWAYELKAGDDPKVDHIERRALEKQQRVVKNQLNRVANAERATSDRERASGGAGAALFASRDAPDGGRPHKKQKRRERDGAPVLEDGAGGVRRAPAGIPSIPLAEGRADALAGGGKQPRVKPGDSRGVKEAQLRMAQISTASLGRFDRKSADEPARPVLNKAKRKRLPNELPVASEKGRDADVLKRVLKGAGDVDGEVPRSRGAGAAAGGGAGLGMRALPKSSAGGKARKAGKPKAPKGGPGGGKAFKGAGGGKPFGGGGGGGKPHKGGKPGKR